MRRQRPVWARGGSSQPAVSARGPRRGGWVVAGVQEGCFVEGGWCLVVTAAFPSGTPAGLDKEPRRCHLRADTPQYPRDAGHHPG